MGRITAALSTPVDGSAERPDSHTGRWTSGERRWTDELGRTPRDLVSSEALPTGVLHLVYRPSRQG